MLSRRNFLATIAAPLAQGQKRPLNFLIVLADDLGASTVGCYGNRTMRTPNLDRMAAQGVRFETCYATPLCSPTRVSFMTGRYPQRTGWYNFIGRVTTRKERIEADEITFGDVVKTRGYKTGLSGKWQLGLITKHPTMIHDNGFDDYFSWAWNQGGLPEGSPNHDPRQRYWHPAIIENGKYVPTKPKDYGPDLFSDWTLNFMKRHRNEPFLAYHSMVLIHEPWEATPDSNGKGGLEPCVAYMDKEMGKLLRGLDDLGLRDNTVVLFMGDNGTGQDGKGSVTERGVRVPMIVSGPGIRKGHVSRELIDCSDVLPTIAELAGAPLPSVPIDGHSFAWELQGKRGKPREWIFSYLAYERMLRDKRWLLEGDGKFYDCGESRDGSGYRDVSKSTDPEVAAARSRFAAILEKLPAPPPEAGEPTPARKKKKAG